MSNTIPQPEPEKRITQQPKHKKLQKLPKNVRIEKRPLLHPAIPSPYSSSREQKVIYVSAKTPFLSAVKRAEKLLHLSDQRLVQSASTLAKQNSGRKRKRGGGAGEDEILEIAERVERQKRSKGDRGDDWGEEVVLKGTGKAIQKVMQLGLWFQQRAEYVVKLRTGSVAAIDDICVEEKGVQGVVDASMKERDGKTDDGLGADDDHEKDEGGETLDARKPEDARGSAGSAQTCELKNNEEEDSGVTREKSRLAAGAEPVEPIPETRVRYTSSLEVAVSLR